MLVPAVFLQDPNFTDALYIVAFALFIYGMSGLTGPRTAVRGNKIAAGGMALAFVATLLQRHALHGSSTPWLIALGIVLGAAVGVPAARNVKMTQMPQMVAMFNGVGGGAVALIAWVEYRHHYFGAYPAKAEIPSLFAAIVGSISFWGSNIAFAKLQELLPGRPLKLPGQALVNLALLLVCVASAVALAAGTHSQALFVLGILVAAAILGNMVVLPIGGADMPVVISLLNAFTGLSAAATGIALDNTALIVAGMIVGASGSILTNLMAKAMNRSVPAIVAGGFGGAVAAPAAGDGEGGTVRSTSAQDVAIQLTYARQVVVAPGYGMAVAQAQHAVRELELLGYPPALVRAGGKGRRGQVRDPSGRRADAGPHERAAGRSGCPLRAASGDGRDQSRVPPHRCDAGDRRQRRHQPGRQEPAGLADLRDADPRGRPLRRRDRAQALDGIGVRGDRQPAVLRPQDLAAVRRREGIGKRDHERGAGAVAGVPSGAEQPIDPPG